jgi:hypothetical protein
MVILFLLLASMRRFTAISVRYSRGARLTNCYGYSSRSIINFNMVFMISITNCCD